MSDNTRENSQRIGEKPLRNSPYRPGGPDRTDIERTQRLLGGRYELNWIVGRGGMSVVWLAWDNKLERDVAVKILKPEYTENHEFRTRFRNEAEVAEKIINDNVVRTYHYGEVQDNGANFCFIIMEYIRGESLADVLSRERVLPEAMVLDILTQAAIGLQAIHGFGLVHRDIKPGNLLITSQGVVKISDFGIAKAAAAVPLTRTGMVVGTAQYVSPEQAQGMSVGPESDIYSLGVVAYEALMGERPFSGDNSVSVAIKHINDAPAPLPERISDPMRALVEICMRKAPHSRYADGDELAKATVFVRNGELPPRPHRVPEVPVDDNPLTDRIAQVATGPGNTVPPVHDDLGRRPAPVRPREDVSPSGNISMAPHVAPARRPGASAANKPEDRKGTLPLLIVGGGGLLALGILLYVLLSGNDAPAPGNSTTTITNEVTSTPESGSGGESSGGQGGTSGGEYSTDTSGGQADQPLEGGSGSEPGQQAPHEQPSHEQPSSGQQPGNGNQGGHNSGNGNGNGGATTGHNNGNGNGGANTTSSNGGSGNGQDQSTGGASTEGQSGGNTNAGQPSGNGAAGPSTGGNGASGASGADVQPTSGAGQAGTAPPAGLTI